MDEEKDLERLIDKLFEEDGLDAPSFDFTSTVLEKIEVQRKEKLAYTPLLPKWVFVVLIALVAVFFVYVLSLTDSGGLGVNYFESLNFSTSWLTKVFSQFNFSITLGYSVLAVGLLMCIQASLLNKFLKRTNSLA